MRSVRSRDRGPRSGSDESFRDRGQIELTRFYRTLQIWDNSSEVLRWPQSQKNISLTQN